MTNVKLRVIGKCFSAIWIISITLLIDAAYMKIGSQQPSSEFTTIGKPPFKDFKVEAEVYQADQRALRLKITWDNQTTTDSMFHVTVHAIEGGICQNKPCNLSNRVSYNATLFVPMKPPSQNVYHPDICHIEPGCNYTVKVESDNFTFESEVTYTVPDQVGEVYSCQHVMNLPVLETSAKIDSQILTMHWNIIGNYSVPSDIYVYIVVIITDEREIENELEVFNRTLDIPKQRSGQIEWNVPSKDVNYLTRTFVYDSHGCSSRVNPRRAWAMASPAKHHDDTDSNYPVLVKWLIIAVFSSVVIILVASLIYFKTKENRPSPYQFYCPPKRSGITIIMKDNPTYPTYDILEEIPHSNLQLIKKIGEGAFGTVYIARGENICGRPGFQTVAVKQLKKRPTEVQKEEFFGEIQTMKNVSRHPNIVALLGYCTRREPLQIVMEYVGCGDLRAYLHKLRARHEERYGRNRVTIPCEPNHPLLAPPSGRYLDLMNSSATSTSDSSHATESDPTNLRPSVTETMYTTLSNVDGTSTNNSLESVLDHKELHNFARQIAEGMKHLHDMKITHRDLAARNILIDEHKTLKISDFGLSRSDIYVNTKNKPVPLRWLSIEAMRDDLYSDKSDVWAFGIVLWEIGALGGHPYHTVSNYDLLPYLSAGNRLEKPENCSNYLYELMKDCWAARPDDRPDFSQILSKLELHQRIYVDFSEISSDYVFPPTKEQIQNNKLSNGLKH